MSDLDHVRAALGDLIGGLRDAVGVRELGPGHFELAVVGGHPVGLVVTDATVTVEFAGWQETTRLQPDEDDDAVALALDFAAAALFGDLRVTVDERNGIVHRRRLEVRVDDCWRLHGSRGRRGLAGLLRRSATHVVHNRVARPRGLADRLPTGQPHAPWAGAGGFAWAPPMAPAGLPIDGELDLHDFPPREVGAVVREYIDECRQRGVRDLRLVHGKGIGALRRTVHAVLAGHPAVENYRLGGHGEGSWGATIVRLRG